MKVFKINSVEYSTEEDITILDFLKKIGIYIPVLCYHPYLKPVGKCRICVIKDRGRYRNSCTTKIEHGMDIQTHTPELIEMRKWMIQFLFGERNHYCMYCPITNDCEFQNLGYYTGLDHFHFSTYENIFDTDNSHPYILFDNNRCVLCTRCIRVCSEIAGHSVLSEKGKGIHSIIVADNGVPLGESSCTSCGLCVQVCPTGTFVDKISMYQGRSWETNKFNSFCFSCPVGCGIEVYTRGSNIVKIYSDWNSFTKGLICYKGRYQAVINYRKNRRRELNSIDDVIEKVRNLIDENSVAVVDGTLFNEELEKIKTTFPKTFTLYEVNPKILQNNIKIDQLENYQTFIISGWDLDKEYGSLGSIIKRSKLHRNCRVIHLDKEEIQFNPQLTGKAIFIYKNFCPKQNLNINELEIDELVLPINTNDIGLLKIIGNQSISSESNLNTSNLFVFSRDLKVINDRFIEKSQRKFLFTYNLNSNTEMFDHVFGIVSEFETNGSFYNLFNELIYLERVFEKEVV